VYEGIRHLDAVFLGIIQGLTEFLPVSSSGHLAILQNLLGYDRPELLFDVALHLGTLLSVCIYFRSDLLNMFQEASEFVTGIFGGEAGLKDIKSRPAAHLMMMVLIGTIPTGLIGIMFRSQLEGLFASVTMTGIALIFTGSFLLISRYIGESEKNTDMVTLFSAICVGTAQGIAIIPGISRSGITIICGLLCGLSRDLSARFSFILSIPAIIAAMLLQLYSEKLTWTVLLPLLVGFVSSALIGLMALRILMNMVRKGKLFFFSPYCWALGLLAVCLGIMR